MHKPKLNYKVILVLSILLFAFGFGFGFIAFPEMLREMIKSVKCIIFEFLNSYSFLKFHFILIEKEMHLGNDSKIRPFYEKAPIYIDFRIYVFNVTNKDEMLQGSE